MAGAIPMLGPLLGLVGIAGVIYGFGFITTFAVMESAGVSISFPTDHYLQSGGQGLYQIAKNVLLQVRNPWVWPPYLLLTFTCVLYNQEVWARVQDKLGRGADWSLSCRRLFHGILATLFIVNGVLLLGYRNEGLFYALEVPVGLVFFAYILVFGRRYQDMLALNKIVYSMLAVWFAVLIVAFPFVYGSQYHEKRIYPFEVVFLDGTKGDGGMFLVSDYGDVYQVLKFEIVEEGSTGSNQYRPRIYGIRKSDVARYKIFPERDNAFEFREMNTIRKRFDEAFASPATEAEQVETLEELAKALLNNGD